MSDFNQVVFDKIVKRASDFVSLENNIEIEMLKIAMIATKIDIEKLCVFNDQRFKHDIVGLMMNFDFETMTCNEFLPLSSKKFEKIVKRARDFIKLEDDIEIEMLKIAMIATKIDIEKLCVFNDQRFKHDIIGLMMNFDFETMTCNAFVPFSSNG